MPHTIRRLLYWERQESDAARADLVADLVTAFPEMLLVAGSTMAVEALVARRAHSPFVWACLGITLFITICRLAVLAEYRRGIAAGKLRGDSMRRWEWRYGTTGVVLSLTIGGTCLLAFLDEDTIGQMLALLLLLSYAGGLISRIAVRPGICLLSLLVMTTPAVLGLFLRARGPNGLDYTMTLIVLGLFMLAAIRTVSHRYQMQRRLVDMNHQYASLVLHDALTGLPNRVRLPGAFTEEMRRARRQGTLVALHYLDLDGFKPINDALGHGAGDEVLQAVAGRLSHGLPVGDLVARVGGDEFVVLQAGVHAVDQAEALARRLIRLLGEPYALNDGTVSLGVSIGIALAPVHGIELSSLAGCADAALYAAKRSGRGTAVVYKQSDPSLQGPRWSQAGPPRATAA